VKELINLDLILDLSVISLASLCTSSINSSLQINSLLWPANHSLGKKQQAHCVAVDA